MSSWVAWLERPIAVFSWAVALVLSGVWVAAHLPVEWIPSITFPEIEIQAGWPGASPRQMERQVTAPLERETLQVPGMRSVESRSGAGTASLQVTLEPDRHVERFAAELQERFAALRSSLPQFVSIRLQPQAPESLREHRGFMTLQLVGPYPPDRLRRLADETVAPRLAGVPGVRRVQVSGGQLQEVVIELDGDRLTATGLTPGVVFGALLGARFPHDYGRVERLRGAPLVLTPGIDSLAGLKALPILDGWGDGEERGEPLRLGDLASIDIRPAPLLQVSHIDGEPAIALRLQRVTGSHLLEVARSVKHRMTRIQDLLPPVCHLLITEDQSDLVRRELWSLAQRGGAGLILVVIVLWLILRSLRACLFVLGNVAVSLSASLLLMQPLGLTLNLVTIAGLVLLVGLMADNGLVVAEQLLRRRAWASVASAEKFARITRQSLSEVLLPLVGGTVTTIAVLIPLVYLSGELRELFVPLGALLGVALLASLATAAFMIPVLFRHFPASSKRTRPWGRSWRWIWDVPLRFVARHPKMGLLCLALLIGAPIHYLPQRLAVPEEGGWSVAHKLTDLYETLFSRDGGRHIRPALDVALGGLLRPFLTKVHMGPGLTLVGSPEIVVRFELPRGSEPRRLEELLIELETRARQTPGVRQTEGYGSEDQGVLRVRFTEEALAHGQALRTRRALDQLASQRSGLRINIAGIDRVPFSSGYEAGEIGGFVIRGQGANYEELDRLLISLQHRLEQHPRISGVDPTVDSSGRASGHRSWQLPWTASAVAQTGVNAQAMTALLGPRLHHVHASLRLDLADQVGMPVRVRLAGAEDLDLYDLLSSSVSLGTARSFVLGQVTQPIPEVQPAIIERLDQRYVRYLAVPFRGPPKLADREIKKALSEQVVPPGYQLELIGESSSLDTEIREQMGPLLAATAGLVFLCLVVVLESWRYPLWVAVSAATGFLGLAGAFLLSGATLTEGALLGLVLLIGIVVNDGVLLVDRFRDLRGLRPGQPPSRLARLATRQRLRPMWTTTLTTICGLLPLLVMSDNGSFWFGFSLVVVGGLLSATVVGPPAVVALAALEDRRHGSSKGR